MCFSFRASVAAAITGVVSAVLILFFLSDRVEDPIVGRAGAILPALLITPAIVQACDAVTHMQIASGAAHSSWGVGLICYVAIMSQPVILSATVGLMLQGTWLLVLGLNVCAVVLSLTLNLTSDAPVSDWLRIEIVDKEDKLSSVIHGFFAFGGARGWVVGPSSRAATYFVTLGLGFVGLVVLVLDVDGRTDEPYARPIATYMLGLGAALWALYLVSELYVNLVSRTRHHVSSVWCAISLTATTAFGLYLTTAKQADRGYGVLFLVGTLGTYVATYAFAGSPHGQEPDLRRVAEPAQRR